MTALFTTEELEQIRVEAKAEAAKLLKEHLIKQAIGEGSNFAVRGALVNMDASIGISTINPTESDDWVIAPPVEPKSETDPQDEFAETSVYGIALRVNRTGTHVQVKMDGKWVDRAIYHYSGEGKKNAVPVVYLPNRLCSSSRGKDGSVSYRLTHLVKQAFEEMPKYISDVLYSRKGPSIIFGLRLCRQINGDVNDCRLENIEWIPEHKFQRAVYFKKKRLGITDEA